MRMLLTSTGFNNKKIGEAFLEAVTKPASEIRVLFITTASTTDEELHYVKLSKKELLELGVQDENILVYSNEREMDYEEAKEFDVMYVCGGNTYYLMDKLRKTKFDDIIKKFVDDGGFYVGVSAGSVIVGHDISLSGDKNIVGITDIMGLKLINVVIEPHFVEEKREKIKEFVKMNGPDVIALTDEQALLIDGDEKKIIE